VNRIETLLNRQIGLNASSIGPSAIDAAVKARLRETGLSKLPEYLEQLEHDAAERRALVEEIVVSETWFFRDEEMFRALGRCARGWLHRERPLRILSLPCATGEEAYSVSIALLELGFKPTRYAIQGVDVSERAIEQARRGSYGRISFRGAASPSPGAYFERTATGFRVVDLARQAVTFAAGNVLDRDSFAPRSFDLLLCRNLLIYLDQGARQRALDNLAHWLVDDGVLFAGHAEAIERMSSRFQRLSQAAPFGYAKSSSGTRELRSGATKTVPVPRTRPKPVTAPAHAPGERVVSPPRASLERATELANAGQLGEARRLCELVIDELGPNPDAYCLLGIVDSAAGNRDTALQSFNKALYLAPGHHEALVHVALLHDQRGEHVLAANFRRRADRTRRSKSQ
jgi:chemotaxis protein methyltransferase WspC